ncbi:histidine kinase [Streptomyces sp. ACA25]|uniref:sensor histidine kinase n=1 Tax=Streptomyces sp. ACA25 TaxID=3022596 RepID=UPI00230811FA|nr:histidine kinase [Streptomyces sp. ACA25]MDB1086549.1 histidine kinase [Streptomyces sp. ACA25]
MTRSDDRLLPLLVLCAQAAAWPGADLIRGIVPAGTALLVAALVAGLVTAALSLRRSKPVTVLVLIAAACALGAGPLPPGAVAVLGTAGVALALFTVACERDTFTALLCLGALATWQFLHNLSLHGLSDRNGLDLVLTVVLYAAASAAGLLVRRARRARQASEHLLKRAETERHRLPAAERRRMERELHDVSAHHLTAVVVTAGAALGLRDRRPELAGEALRFAAETGREVTRALGAVRAPTPSREEMPSPRERLLGLVTGFSQLGQRVESEIDPLPNGAVADAAYGIVRESLTNVARHAPGAPTTVRCRYGDARTEVVVTSGAPPAGSAAHAANLGSGRGQGFLRSRAREAGGTLTSGPTEEGGWEVRAVLPGRTAAASVERSVPWNYRLAQVTAAAGLVLQPLLPVLVIRADAASSEQQVSAGMLFALLAAAQALALLWQRRAPAATQAAVLGLALLWPVAMVMGEYTGWVLLPPLLSMIATCAAVSSAAVRTATTGPLDAVPLDTESRPRVPLWAGPVVAVVVHAAATTAAVLHRGTTVPLWALIAGATAQAAMVIGAAWWGGALRGRRGRAARTSQARHLAAWTEEAVRDAWAERRRIATGLETTVLARTADMVAQAEAGRLEAVAERAREALAAMRALLDTVRDAETTPALRPQPTLQALDLLAHQIRATGRDVEILLTDRIPRRLPTTVDLAAYHACETVLAAGDEPVVMELDADEAALTITATGVPDPVRPALCQQLAVRAAVIGGTATTSPTARGQVRIRLPLTAPAVRQDDEEEQR